MDNEITNTNVKVDDLDPCVNRILLEETFYVLTKKNCVFRVKLTTQGLHVIKERAEIRNEQIIPVTNIVGSCCLRRYKPATAQNISSYCACQSLDGATKHGTLRSIDNAEIEVTTVGDFLPDETDNSVYLYIYAYTMDSQCQQQQREQHRQRTVLTLRFRSFDTFADNRKEAQRWRTTIKRLVMGRGPQQRRLLVFCSTKSGRGKARHIFQTQVVPMLQEADLPYDLHITTYANYARELVRNLQNIYQWTAILIVGGDGLIFEVVNGLFERWDWSEAIRQLPISVIAGGSGNGLARSLAYYYNRAAPYCTVAATIAAVHHRVAPMDLMRVETTNAIMYAFLSIGWGLIADIDIGSECLRALGVYRFTLWSLLRLVNLRSYAGILWYLPAANQQCQTESSNEATPIIADSILDLSGEVGGVRSRLNSWYSAASKPSAYYSAVTGSSYQSFGETTLLSNGESPDVSATTATLAPRMYGPASQLPALTTPISSSANSSEWVRCEDRFLLVHACNQSHLSEDHMVAPQATLIDGVIWLMIVRGGATRYQLLQFLMGMKNGQNYANNAGATTGGLIEFVPVKAFRIEPTVSVEEGSGRGYLTVDGENVDYGPIQAEIVPQLGRILIVP